MRHRFHIPIFATVGLAICSIAHAGPSGGSYLTIGENGKALTQTYSYSAQGSKYSVLFEPMLPRNDMAFTMAVSEVAPKILGVPVSGKTCTVAMESVGSVRAAVFRCPAASVFVVPMKDDATGKIWGFAIWK